LRAYDQQSETEDGVERTMRVGNYFDNTAFYMGKYIGSDLFAQAILAFRYDPYREQYGGVRLEPDIGLSMRTPLADIQWNMVPQQQHLEHMFIDDQTISVIWRRSF